MKHLILLSLLLASFAATTAHARIPDFHARTAPDVIKNSPNPKAREFYKDLVEHSKQQGRKMVEDTTKTTGLKATDLKKVDWDCLFWRVAATTSKNLRRRFPGLQPPEFANMMEQTALDKDDCPDEGGPGSNGVRVYNAAINQVSAGRGGWQMVSADGSDVLKALAGTFAAGLNAGEVGVPAGASPAGLVPQLHPKSMRDVRPPALRETDPNDVL